MADKKVFDIAHPQAVKKDSNNDSMKTVERKLIQTPEAAENPEVANEATSVPELISHKASVLEPIDLKAEVKEETMQETKLDSKSELEIQTKEAPETQKEEPDEVAPTLVESDQQEKKNETKSQPEDKDVPVSASFEANDSLPDDSQKATAATKEAMQEPKIFDTKAYYVPIGGAHHTHGHAKSSIVVGLICAALVVGGAVYVLYILGS